jgi:hypothetical protein
LAGSRCAECRASVEVGDDFAHGAQIRCGSCHTSLRVVRGAGVGPRLVHADPEPIREALTDSERRLRDAEKGLRAARASLGIGVNGLGLGVLYVVAKVGLEELPLTSDLIYTAVAIAIVAGIGLELVNFLFLAKRRRMAELGAEIDELRSSTRELRRKLREALRG